MWDIGVLVAMALYGRRTKRPFFVVTDFIAPLIPPGLFFGRIGNFINGELWGKPTDVPWGMLYNGQVLHASMLYEALLEGFVLFAILWWFSSKPRPYMAVSGLFLLLYGVFRFLIEFVRVPDEHLGYLFAEWVTMGQILSAPMIIVGGVMIAMAYGNVYVAQVAFGAKDAHTVRAFAESDEAHEGHEAFNEKRTPDFSKFR